MTDRDRRPGCGDVLLTAIITAMLVTLCSNCDNEAEAQTDTDPVLEEPVVWPIEDTADELEAEPDKGSPRIWLLALPGAVIIAVLIIGAARGWGRRRKKKQPIQKTPKCPACDKPYDGQTYPLPRLVVPRRVFNLGRVQITWPENEEEQAVEVCPSCYEVGLMLTRVERERTYERRAKDRTGEMDSLMRFQQSMMEKIKEVRFPTNGKD